MDDTQKIILGVALVTLIIAAVIYFTSGRGKRQAAQQPQQEQGSSNGNDVTVLGDESQQEAQMPSNRMMVMFFSPGCDHCEKMMPAWNEFAQNFDGYNGIRILLVNGAENQQLCQLHGVRGFPTVKFCPNGVESPEGIVYEGDRSVGSLAQFLQQF